jgi:hypothetical protein
MKDRAIFIIAGVTVAAAIGVLIATKIGGKKKAKPVDNGNPDQYRPGVPESQLVLPPDLAALMDLPLDQARQKLKGRKVWTKVNNVNVRSGPKADNGWINNKMANIPAAGTYAGTIADVAEDGFGGVNAKGRVWRWVKFAPFDRNFIDIMNKNDSSLLDFISDYTPNTSGWLGEETIKLTP